MTLKALEPVKGIGVRLTLKAAKAELSALGVTLTKKPEYGEYRVNVVGGTEATACYTNDLEDALGTGRHIAKQHREDHPIHCHDRITRLELMKAFQVGMLTQRFFVPFPNHDLRANRRRESAYRLTKRHGIALLFDQARPLPLDFGQRCRYLFDFVQICAVHVADLHFMSADRLPISIRFQKRVHHDVFVLRVGAGISETVSV